MAAVLLALASPLAAQTPRPATPNAALTRACAAMYETVHRAAIAAPIAAPPGGRAWSGFELRSRSQADRAMADLTAAAAGRSGCAAAIALRGLVKWQIVGRGWIPNDGIGQAAGESWDEAAIRDLASAARSSGVLGNDAALLAANALLSLGTAGAALIDNLGRQLIGRFTERGLEADTARQLARGRLALRISLLAVADSSFRAYFEDGGQADIARLELARAELATGVPGADTLYYAAAGSREPGVIDELVRDLLFIADSGQLRELRASEGSARVVWLRTFWEQRDLASLRARGSRLREHYVRLAYARAHYRVKRYPRRFETFELWRNPSAEFDDRGMIFLRHGFPDDSAGAVATSFPVGQAAATTLAPTNFGQPCSNVTWLYRRAGGNLIFNFAARDDPDDWRLVETLFNVNGENGFTNRLRAQNPLAQCVPILGLFASRSDIDPLYAKLAVRYSRMDAERELKLTTRSREVGTTTDSHELRFANTVRASLQTYALFGASPASGRVLFVLTTPVEDLRVGSDSIGELRLHIVATQPAQSAERDTVRTFRVRGGAGSRVTISDATALPRGAWTAGLVVRVGELAGEFFRIPRVDVPGTGAGFAMSDIVAAQEIGGHVWPAPDGPLNLNPSGAYTVGQPIVLYYEVGGTGAGTPVGTRIELTDGRRTISAAFSDVTTAAVTPFRRAVASTGLREGPLTARITVTNASGESLVRELQVRLVQARR